MGVSISKTRPNYTVLVKTGDVKGAGTDANVYISFIDENGKKSRDILLDCKWRDDFEKGSTDTFKIRNTPNLGPIEKIELWRDTKGLNDDWYVEWVKVRALNVSNIDQVQVQNGYLKSQTDKVSPEADYVPFPCHRWINEKGRFTLLKYDSVLPQFDDRKEQRKLELEEKRKKFEFAQKAHGLPRQVKKCPGEQSFSNDYKWDIMSRKFKLLAHRKLRNITSDNWQTLDDVLNVYKGPFSIPNGYYNWKSDEQFGQQRLSGVNPTLLRFCSKIPSKIAVTSEMVEPFLDGLTLDEAVENKRIFIIDLDVLDKLECCVQRVICAPIALFFVGQNGELVPIAIQLFQEPGNNNPVFLPSDPKYLWMLVKMYYNNADAALHQACTHLGFTHLVGETICVSVHRELSPSHPVYRLLAPHFLYLIAINSLALDKLVAPGGWIDSTMTMGTCGMFGILRIKWSDFRLDVQGWIPNDLKERGVDDPEILKDYPYRDDAILIHKAIWDYVRNIITHVYDQEDKLTEDFELQCWAKELVGADSCAIKGVAGGGKFENVEDLITVLTSIIFLCSVSHAAANFNQYDEYGYPPNYPAILRGNVPTTKVELREKDIVDHLPTKAVSLSIMVVTMILSDRGTNGLGDFEIPYMYDPHSLEAVERFKEELLKISSIIQERNKSRLSPYPYLDPKEVPNAISI